MELQSEENGDTISIPSDHTVTTLGRSNAASNLAVSRRHLTVKLTPESTLSFEVIGKNPILVLTDGSTKFFRNGEKGELREGDKLSLSIQRPSLWVVMREVERSILEAVKRRERRTMGRRREREQRAQEEFREGGKNGEFELELELENLDLSNIDPVKEYGFLVTGHEFDAFPKCKIRPMKNWNWYLDKPKENSDESDNEKDDFTHEPSTLKSNSTRRSKKRGKAGAEDEDWTGEIDEEDLIAKDASGLKSAKYATRSKDLKIPSKKLRRETMKEEEDTRSLNEEDDEDDETLGGFIVTDEEEEINNQEEEEEKKEEEEEFEDEENED